ELFSIDPDPGPEGEPRMPDGRGAGFTLQQWPILGSVVIDPAAGRAITETLVLACEGWDGSEDECAFEPRHALRAKDADRSVDLVVCFACDHLVIDWSDGHRFHYLMGGHRELKRRMNDLLCQAGVPLAADPNA